MMMMMMVVVLVLVVLVVLLLVLVLVGGDGGGPRGGDDDDDDDHTTTIPIIIISGGGLQCVAASGQPEWASKWPRRRRQRICGRFWQRTDILISIFSFQSHHIDSYCTRLGAPTQHRPVR